MVSNRQKPRTQTAESTELYLFSYSTGEDESKKE